jgi:hypothetical protein
MNKTGTFEVDHGHESHASAPIADVEDNRSPVVNRGIMYCYECEQEYVPGIINRDDLEATLINSIDTITVSVETDDGKLREVTTHADFDETELRVGDGAFGNGTDVHFVIDDDRLEEHLQAGVEADK